MKKFRKILFFVLSLCVILFIFSNSLEIGSDSAQKSGWVAHFLKGILDPGNRIAFDVFHHFVRKAAHFTEFAALGFCLTGYSGAASWKKRRARLLFPALTGLAVASVDECIQIFTANRGPSVLDVLLDFSGVLFGLVVMELIGWQITKIITKKGSNSH